MKKYYYLRGERIELEELEEVLAIKVSSQTRQSKSFSLEKFGKERTGKEKRGKALNLPTEDLALFQNAGWSFIAPSQRTRSLAASQDLPTEVELISKVYQDDDQRTYLGTDTLTVQLVKELSDSEAKKKLKSFKLDIVRQYKFGTNLFEVRIPAGEDPFDLSVKLYENKNFIAAEPQLIEPITGRFIPTDPSYPQQWQWSNGGADVSAEAAWDMTRGAEATVAVIDNGFDVNHNDLNPALTPQSGFFSGGTFNQNTGASFPPSNHGTFCAGMAAGRANNGTCGCGAANQARLTLVACQGDQIGTQATLARAIAYAADPTTEVATDNPANGADVIACSLGPNGANWTMQTVLQNAIDFAVTSGRGGLGTPIFWAVTNGNFTINGTDGTDQVCAYQNTICVGRSRNTDVHDSSGFGPELDFLAPGVNVVSSRQGGGCGTNTGTSFAAPCAAGIATLVLSVNDTFNWVELRNLMRDTCDKIGGVTYGADNHHNRYGYGRVNAENAVAEAFQMLQIQMQEIN